MLHHENTGLVIVDVQGKLAAMVDKSEDLLANIQTLIQACNILKLPIILLEQNPQGLGKTVPQLKQLLPDHVAFEKHTFNACANGGFMNAISESSIQQWLVCGIEAHICVYQTALGLVSSGYEVEVVSDCVSSRSNTHVDLALNKLQNNGVNLTSLEMCIYELIKDSRQAEFKAILPLIK